MSTTQKKNTVGIAKTGLRKSIARKPATKKPVAKKATPKLTAVQERDIKAKQKVDELLKDSPLAEPKDDLLILEEEPKGVDWLEEQLLIHKNQKLDYEKLKEENQRLEERIEGLERELDDC